MRLRFLASAATSALLLPLVIGALPSGAASPCAASLCAGAASVDLRWHTGSGQGQLGSAGTDDKFDPFHHATKLAATDGQQSPGFAKAIVIQGADGTKVAYVKNEVYLQQDLLSRRVTQLVSGGDPALMDYAVDGLSPERVMLGGTHNHSAPHYTSTAWGVWAFADAFDLRQFELLAQRIALSIKQADAALAPAKVGASVSRLDQVQQNILGPATADDGTPAGFPRDWFDPELAVVRFDHADGSGPIAALVNLGMHPESISGTDLISADFIGIVERDMERSLGRAPGAANGPVVAWSQGGLGDTEPDQSRAAPAEAGREYWRRDYAQMERMSRVIAGAVMNTWDDIAAGTPEVPAKFVPLTRDAPVAMTDLRFPGPLTHPTPTASNCRTDRPGIPIAGLPDCVRPGNPPEQWGATLSNLRAAGVPVPQNYGAPTYGGVQETTTIHLQVLRIGEIVLATCPCEPIADMTLNFKSRADKAQGNQHHGYEWECRTGGVTGVECNFASASWAAPSWRAVSQEAYARMRAQVRNPADGWEDDDASLAGDVEPTDPAQIRGNFTSTELDALRGYKLPLMVGQANDYIGYVVTYREYQRGDHYRKALTPFGPRTADYVNTRLVEMAGALKDGSKVVGDLPGANLAGAVAADTALNKAKAAVLGAAGHLGLTAYEAAIPDDGGTPGITAQPAAQVQRFSSAVVRWTGGSNWTDQPIVQVQRLAVDVAKGHPVGLPHPSGKLRGNERDKEQWQTVATQEGGEIATLLTYDSVASTAPLEWLTGGKSYQWTAVWETPETTVPGTYRMIVTGAHRRDRAPQPYTLTTNTFTVTPWQGLQVRDLSVAGNTANFEVRGIEATTPSNQWVGPIAALPANQVRYPYRNTAAVPFLSGTLTERGPFRFCFRCTFRAWAFTGQVTSAAVTVDRAAGGSQTYPASFDGSPNGSRWVASGLALQPGDTVRVAPGQVLDEFGNRN